MEDQVGGLSTSASEMHNLQECLACTSKAVVQHGMLAKGIMQQLLSAIVPVSVRSQCSPFCDSSSPLYRLLLLLLLLSPLVLEYCHSVWLEWV